MTTAENWDLFAPQMEDSSTDSFEYHEIKDPGAMTEANTATKTQFVFDLRDVDSYILPSQGFVEVKVRLQRLSGATAVLGRCAIENGACLFSGGRWLVNNKEVETVDHLNKKMLVSNLLEYSGDFGDSSASDQLWYPDTNAGGAVVTPYSTTITGVTTTVGAVNGLTGTTSDVATYNKGFDKRSALFSDLKVVNLRIPLSRIFGFCKSIQTVSIGSTHRCILDRMAIEDVLHGNDDAFPTGTGNATMSIQSISLWIPYVKPSRMTEDRILKQLSDGGSRTLNMEYSQVYTTRQVATASVNWNINSAVEKPTKVIVFFQPVLADTATKNVTNKSIFAHNSLTTCSLSVGGQKFPEFQHQVSFADLTKDYTRLYHEFLRCSDKNFSDYNTGTSVSYKDFGTLYPMFCFDLRESPEKLFSAGNATDIIFKATFSPAPTDPFDIYAMVVSERVLKMDLISRKVLFDRV